MRIAFLLVALALWPLGATAQDAASSPAAKTEGDPQADLRELVSKVVGGIKEGRKTAAQLQPEIRQFDGLLMKYREQKSDEVAEILFTRAMLYLQVLADYEAAIEDVRLLQKSFPDSSRAKKADEIIESIGNFQDAAARVKRVRTMVEEADSSLKIGRPFPDFRAVDIEGKTISIEQFKGKVVLVDFWATWCGPCIGEIPHVKQAYEKYHEKGFEIIAISLDRNVKQLKGFIKEQDLKWRQVFDRDNDAGGLAEQYSVRAIPTTYLIGRDGNIAAKNLRGHALEIAVGQALKQKD